MRTQINYLFSISFVLLCCFSCSQEETSTFEEPQPVKLQLEFETTSENTQNGGDFETPHLEIISTSPLVIESTNLKVISAWDEQNNRSINGIVRADVFIPNPENDDDPCELTHMEGYALNLNTMCFEHGMYRVWPDCSVTFTSYNDSPGEHIVCLTELVSPL
ncbi:hypothetical protein [Flagellimonas sp.]|uniref:hypothetical protein n=1 Tax=Flagellimonas sp. TaxID=2058762 RepID=UPI003BAEE553